MLSDKKIPNRLINETSPYLIQHAYNPVDWFPWGEEAFKKAKHEDKPIFLSIGYSTCHWCHVMEKESFEDREVAKLLNEHFISIKVDKEERADIDSVYMKYCQAFSGSGGWPMTVFLSQNKTPFFAGTYFPKHTQYGRVGLIELLQTVIDKWHNDRKSLDDTAEAVTDYLLKDEQAKISLGQPDMKLANQAFAYFLDNFDPNYGGFGHAPKFPSAHNLIFLLNYSVVAKNQHALKMAEKTLLQMYKGGIFDHLGYGFSRYSTDNFWLVPHFEKMLYDNALLILAYVRAYEITKNQIYKTIACKTADYILREMTDSQGGFYSAQDADVDGEEGKFYVFGYDEVARVVGDKKFCEHFSVTRQGNFEGKNILNLISNPNFEEENEELLTQTKKLFEYRRQRYYLRRDDKILTSWNSLMIAALAEASRVFGEKSYLEAAKKANSFIDKNLFFGDRLHVSFKDNKVSGEGFADDYAFYVFAQLYLYDSTLDSRFIDKALQLNAIMTKNFFDNAGGYYLYGNSAENLVLRPKETYDGALPSSNSVAAYNLLRLSRLTKDQQITSQANKQFGFMLSSSKNFIGGYSFFMSALLMHLNSPKEIICVLKDQKDKEELLKINNFNTTITISKDQVLPYTLKNDKTTYYVCADNACRPPTNTISEIFLS